MNASFWITLCAKKMYFFLNYVDGKLTENVIAGLVCNGNVSASADTG